MGAEERERLTRRDFLKSGLMLTAATLASCSGVETATPQPENTRTPTPFHPNPPTNTQEAKDTPDATNTQEATDTPEPTNTPEPRTLLSRYIYPALMESTLKRRAEKAVSDPEFLSRVDWEFNKNRLNFMLLGRSGLLTDSIQTISLNVNKNEADVIAMHRDTYAPEVDEFTGEEAGYRINQAFLFGGVDLTQNVLESATGLSADYMFVMDMKLLPDMVKFLFGNRLEVELPWAVPEPPYYYPAGKQVLTAEDIFIVTRARYYGSNYHRNIIQQEVIRSMFSRVKKEMSSSPSSAAAFLSKSIVFMEHQKAIGNLDTNFNFKTFLDVGRELIKVLSEEGVDTSMDTFGFPDIEFGQHLEAQSLGDPEFSRYLLKPPSGNPDSDNHIKDYWYSYRQAVREILTEE